MKMKKTDIVVVAFMYIVSAFFYISSHKLSEESRTYPLFTIYLLFGLTTLYLITMILKAGKFGVESGTDEVFEGFLPKQFFVSLLLTAIYFLMVKYLGFFFATTAYMIAALLFLRVPLVASAITVVCIDLLIFLAFVKFLGVKLPDGLLF